MRPPSPRLGAAALFARAHRVAARRHRHDRRRRAAQPRVERRRGGSHPGPGRPHRRRVRRRAKDEQLYYQAHYDTLTRLPNRLYFRDQLERAIARAERDHAELAVLFVDLDYFKHVNDSVGHAGGDDVLRRGRQADAPVRARSSDIVGASRRRRVHDPGLATSSSGQDAALVAQNVIAALSRAVRRRRRRSISSARASASQCVRRTARRRRICCATPTRRCTARRRTGAASTSTSRSA